MGDLCHFMATDSMQRRENHRCELQSVDKELMVPTVVNLALKGLNRKDHHFLISQALVFISGLLLADRFFEGEH